MLMVCARMCLFFFSSRRRHTRFDCDWSSDVCSSDLTLELVGRGVPGGVGFDPGSHEADFQAERLVGVAATVLLPHARQLLAVPLGRGAQLGRHRGEPVGYGGGREGTRLNTRPRHTLYAGF